MTNAEVLAKALSEFEGLEYEQQEQIADYVECPNSRECNWDGNPKDMSACTECKVKWLQQEWEV